MASPGLDEVVTTTARSRNVKIKNAKPMSANAQAGIKAAQAGGNVPEKDFSPKAKEVAAAGPQGDIAPYPAKAPSTPPVSSSGKMSHGYGHPAPARSGCLRTSGHSGAHQIGKRK